MKCLIQAGGFATRLYPLTLNKAKALLEINGKPVISHIVDRVPPGIDIMVSINCKFEPAFLDWQKHLSRPVVLCTEDETTDGEKKGAVGAIDFWIKKKNITEDLIVVAADNYFEFALTEMMAQFDRNNALVAVYDVGDKDKACEIGKRCQVGLVVVKNDRIIKFQEKPPEPISSTIATGIYLLPSRIFPILERYTRQVRRDNLGDFISYLLGIEEVDAYPIKGVWLDVGDEILKGNLLTSNK